MERNAGRLRLDKLTALASRGERNNSGDAYPDTGESGDAYDAELASESPE